MGKKITESDKEKTEKVRRVSAQTRKSFSKKDPSQRFDINDILIKPGIFYIYI
jgi:hypothetical protein